MTRLLMVAPPFSGHLNPLLTIASELRERGFDPRFATGPTRVDAVRRLGFTASAALARDPGAFDRIADTPKPVRGNPIRLGRQLRANLALLPEIRRELAGIVARDRPEAVLADFTAPVAGLVAAEYGIPWVTVMPTPFVLETRTGTPAYCGGWGPARHLGHRIRDAAGRAATRGLKRGMGLVFARPLRTLGTTVYRPDGTEAAYSPQAILGLGMWELEFPRDWPPVFDLIGPVTATPGVGPVPPDLPDGPLVLVTLGTHLRWAKRDLVRRLDALASAFTDHTFVVSMGDPAAASPNPTEVRRNVVVFGHLPYDDVLGRCVAVVHHGGAGITYSAIRAGLPSLVCPHDYDQFDFAARITEAGIGVAVSRLDGRRAVEALDRVLRLDPAPARRLAEAVTRYDPVTAVERTVGRLLGRPATESPDAPGAASPPRRPE